MLTLAGLDEVWLMVSPQNPLKQGRSDLLNDRLRYSIASIALHGENHLHASDYELALPRPSYTWNTLEHLKADFPGFIFDLIIGGDNWEIFPRWFRSQDIIREHRILVYPRAAVSSKTSVSDTYAALSAQPTSSGTPLFVSAALLPVSSTEVRRRVQCGESIDGLVPKTIAPLLQRCYS